MFRFQRSLPAVRARIHALRQLYRKVLGEITKDARGLQLMRDWLSRINERNSMTQALSKWSVATAENDTESIAVRHRTFLR